MYRMTRNESCCFRQSRMKTHHSAQKEKNDMKVLPNDPVILLSTVNMKLRDFYSSLDALCEDLEEDKQEIIEKLAAIDYEYDAAANQFI